MSKETKEDYLDVDQPIPGQNFVCLSFVSPEKNILQKELYNFYKFTLNILNNENLLDNFKSNNNLSNFNDLYENFIVGNKDTLDKEYNDRTDFQTSVRGVKVRGTYESEKEAKVRAEVLRRRSPNDNVFIGQVGYWLPWDPNPLDVKNLEYQETELNTLMKKYNENMEHREHMFEEEKRTKIDKARKETSKSLEDKKTSNETNETNETNEVTQKKFTEFREILNEKDNLMNSTDPWMQRKEQEVKTTKNENVIEDDSVQESVLKDEDVEQEITINYGEDSKVEPEPEEQLEPQPEEQLEPEPEN